MFTLATPQRVAGKVKGVLNGIAIEDADLFSYIIPVDGRAYTAIAKIPERLGYDLQTLSVFGTIIGWLFSISIKDSPNGFQLTGTGVPLIFFSADSPTMRRGSSANRFILLYKVEFLTTLLK